MLKIAIIIKANTKAKRVILLDNLLLANTTNTTNKNNKFKGLAPGTPIILVLKNTVVLKGIKTIRNENGYRGVLEHKTTTKTPTIKKPAAMGDLRKINEQI